QYRAHIRGLNAYDKHKKFLKDYVSYYGKGTSSSLTLPVKTDQDTLREGYRFIRTEEDDMDTSWEQRLVKRYYDKLFKEYCIADMSKYKSGKIGLRWRSEKEVVSGKGQFICGNKLCDEKDGLVSYEVNFSYFEAGENKQALVKLIACESCAEKLHYRRSKEKEQLEKTEQEEYIRKGGKPRSDSDTDGEHEWSKDKRKQKGSELVANRGKEHQERKRERSKREDVTDEQFQKSKSRKKKGSGNSTSADEEDENFDEFLEGMFPRWRKGANKFRYLESSNGLMDGDNEYAEALRLNYLCQHLSTLVCVAAPYNEAFVICRDMLDDASKKMEVVNSVMSSRTTTLKEVVSNFHGISDLSSNLSGDPRRNILDQMSQFKILDPNVSKAKGSQKGEGNC
ncbi:hypothetical protein Dimus_034207, partial [Dionaea muscipula]